VRALYVGSLYPGSTAAHRRDALTRLGLEVRSFDETLLPGGALTRGLELWSGRLFRRAQLPVPTVDARGVGRALVRCARTARFDLVWFDRPLLYDAALIERVRAETGAIVVAYSPDDMSNRANQSVQLLDALPSFDCFFTTKSFGVVELTALGARRVIFVDNAFEATIHRPMHVTDAQRSALGGPVGFMGTFEAERVSTLIWLAEQGVPVRVWGGDWARRMPPMPPNMKHEDRNLWGEDYARALCAFDINLGFLRRENRDLQTTRSVEIPACGAFMLAERSPEHLRLFAEGVEAEYFSDRAELLEKVRYYLAHPVERARIAEAGLRRCLRDGYDNVSRMRCMLAELGIVPVHEDPADADAPPTWTRVTEAAVRGCN